MKLFLLRASLTLGILWLLYRLVGCTPEPPMMADAMRMPEPSRISPPISASAWPQPILVTGEPGTVWYSINVCGTPPLPDSLVAMLRAGDLSGVLDEYRNPGSIVMGWMGDHFVTCPLDTLDGMWPTPDGWVRWLRVYYGDTVYSAYWRQRDSTCVRMWLPSASPSYGD